jgi:RNA polymerase sigma-70 factor (ECF subfamily)
MDKNNRPDKTPDNTSDNAIFLSIRPRLLRLAYRMSGSVVESEDIVQETWIRWAKRDFPKLENPIAYFTTITTRLCLDYIKSSRAKREHYVGVWLPEPVLEGCDLMATTIAAEEKLDISYAIMMVMEKLSPLERAAYLLHDLFDISFDEIASVIERTPASCRKLASRARKQLEMREKRYEPSKVVLTNLLNAFFESRQTGNPAALMEQLAFDVKFHSDGGGKVSAALNTIFGAQNVAKLLLGLARKSRADQTIQFARVNGQNSILLQDASGPAQPICLDLNEQGQIATIYTMRNPDKLTRFH